MRRFNILIVAVFLATAWGVQAQGVSILQLAGQEVRSGRVLARLKPATDALQKADALQLAGMRVARELPLVPGLVVLESQDPAAVAALPLDQQTQWLVNRIQTLKDSGRFLYVEPDHIARAALTPNDSAFTSGVLWGLRNLGQNGGKPGADIGVTNAWDVTVGSTNVIVAVIDTGVRYTHRDLAAQMWRNPGEIPGNGIDDDGDGFVDNVYGINAITGSGDPFDDNDHGTHCSGTIGAAANDINPHVGVAWKVQIMGCKFLGAGGFGAFSDAITCIDFAVRKKVRILSNSWGGGGFSQALHDSILAARNAGVLFVAAAMNGGIDGIGDDNDTLPMYPASFDLDNIVSVAALDRNDNLAVFSNFGRTSVDIGAPGVEIFSTTAGSDTEYQIFQGTSMATPHVSGVAALVLSTYTNMPLTELRNRLLNSVVPVAALQGKSVTGGRVNAASAIGFGVPSLSVTNVAVGEGNTTITNVVFTVTLSSLSTNTVQVSYATSNITAAANNDYYPVSGTLSFLPGIVRQTINVPVIGDSAAEQNETFSLNFFNVSNALLVNSQAVGTILNDDGPVLRISDVTINEGDGTTNAIFTVTLSQQLATPVSVGFASLDGTANAGLDYMATNGTLTFSPGVLTQAVTVPIIGDLITESNESFYVVLTNPSGATLFKDVGVGTIIDDEGRLIIDDTGVVEGDSGTVNAVFAVHLTKAVTNNVSVSYRTGSFSAVSGLDFVQSSGSLIIPAGTTNAAVTVPVIGETLNETNEIFTVTLFSASNALITRASAVCIITNDDALPGISVTNAVTVTEGNTGTTTNAMFVVRLTSASGQLITVDFTTGVGKTNTVLANAGLDYVATSGTLVFAPGVTSNAVPVAVIGDNLHEADETFSLRIFNPVQATNVVAQDTGYCTIQNDDGAPIMSISSPSSSEGNSGTNNVAVTVSLSIASGLTVSAGFTTADQAQGATSTGLNPDYVSTSGAVVFPPGSTTQTIYVPIVGDTATEPNETFFVNLTNISNALPSSLTSFATILNDDGPILTINDLAFVEGNSGASAWTFTVTLAPTTNVPVTVSYATANGTAIAGLDYTTTSGMLTFPAGTSSQTISVQVAGEASVESNEVFYVNLSNPTNATILKAQGIGNILDDDTLADLALLVSRSSATEWNGTNYVGHEVTYNITVTNSGPFSATNVVITNVFSTGVVFVSATNSQGTYVDGGNSFTFNLGVVASNASATVALVISPTNTAGLTNGVGVYGIQPDTNLANNLTSLVSAVEVPFVRLTNSAVVTVTAESIVPANGAIDPGEIVTLSLNLANSGNVSTTNLTVTLAATNGVTPITATQTYGVIAAGGSLSKDFEFQAGSGGNLPLVFTLVDGASPLGIVATNFTTGSDSGFTNAAVLTVPEKGPAAPSYPSIITVSNLVGVVNKVTVTLSNVTHTFPSDLDILLVAPNGASVMLMSDVSVGDNPLSNVTLTFDDAAAAFLPESAQIASGSYKPTNYATNDVFANGPVGPFGSTLSVFSGMSQGTANGVWSLYVVDDANGDGGSIGGWSLAINTVTPVNNTAELSLTLKANPNPVLVGSNLVYSLIITNHGPKTASSVTVASTLPASASLISVTTASGTIATNEYTLIFSMGSLASGVSVTNSITVVNPGAGTATNYAQVTALETDVNLANNFATSVVQVNRVLELMSQSAATFTNGFGFTVVGQSGLTYVLEASTNLVNWTPILTNPPTTNGIIQFIDSNAPGSTLRFYRAMER